MIEFLRILPLPFFSALYYRYAARRAKGIGGRFILVVTLLMFAVAAIGMGMAPWQEARAGFARIAAAADRLPVLTIANGALSIDKPSPYTLDLTGEGAAPVRIVIDTEDPGTDPAAAAEKMKQGEIDLYATRHTIFARGAAAEEFRSRSLTSFYGPVTVTPAMIVRLAAFLQGGGLALLAALSAVFLFLSLLAYNLTATALTATVAAVLSSLLRSGLTFDGAMRISAALRLPATLFSLLPFVNLGAGWLIWLCYLAFAVWSTKQDEHASPA